LDTLSLINIHKDAFSSGQIGSKIWLCNALETIFGPYEQNIWILGGWYGLSAFLLLSRGIIPVNSIRSFDKDPACETVADSLCNYWVWQNWKFKAFTADCNELDYTNNCYGTVPSLVINTSCEHFDSLKWYENIPYGTKVALQSNNMMHDDHCCNFESIDQMQEYYKFSKVLFTGTKDFEYPDWSFQRFMILGIR
jgi:hypothetical protein